MTMVAQAADGAEPAIIKIEIVGTLVVVVVAAVAAIVGNLAAREAAVVVATRGSPVTGPAQLALPTCLPPRPRASGAASRNRVAAATVAMAAVAMTMVVMVAIVAAMAGVASAATAFLHAPVVITIVEVQDSTEATVDGMATARMAETPPQIATFAGRATPPMWMWRPSRPSLRNALCCVASTTTRPRMQYGIG
jgi:hypothetical protein